MSRLRASSRFKALTDRPLVVGMAAAALMAAIPNAGYALGLITGSGPTLAQNNFAGAFTPASGDPRVAQIVAERSRGTTHFMRFTPANSSDLAARRVTVAVRVDQDDARAISRTIEGSGDAVRQGLPLATTRYNLGLARGYQSFAKPAAVAAAAPLASADVPDLASFVPAPGMPEKPSRFAARVQFEEGVAGQAAPQLVRRSGQPTADQSLDVAGSYRLTRNLNVTAGLRYSQERDRLATLPDVEEQDSRAIYIGTQFSF